MAKAIDEADTYLTLQIVTGKHNLVFHSKWENLNKVLTDVTGRNFAKSAAGIMLAGQKKNKQTNNVFS